MTLIELLHKCVYGQNKKSVDQIADALGKGVSSIRKAISPDYDDYNLPVTLFAPLMNTIGNYDPLRHVANQCGYEIVRTGRSRAATEQDLDGLPAEFGVFHACLKKAYKTKKISNEEYEICRKFLALVMEQVQAADKIRKGQMEIDFDRKDARGKK